MSGRWGASRRGSATETRSASPSARATPARVVDCGSGGLEAGLGFAAVCMGGLGRIDPVPVVVGERTWPGLFVSADDPAAACLASQYAGWKLEHEKFFALASGPG